MKAIIKKIQLSKITEFLTNSKNNDINISVAISFKNNKVNIKFKDFEIDLKTAEELGIKKPTIIIIGDGEGKPKAPTTRELIKENKEKLTN